MTFLTIHLRIRWSIAALALGLALTSCTDPSVPQITVAEATTSPVAPTPTMPPTTVPGSEADKREVAETVRQFGAAVSRGDEVVALLVLTPSAQQIVAASDLNEFLGQPERPQAVEVQTVQLMGDLATVECRVRYAGYEQLLQLRLVRLEGVWKIDDRMNE